MQSIVRGPSMVCRCASRRFLHVSALRREITHFQMPAMSPTMTEAGIASWKKKEGDSFVQGDVLLEIETDKATIDVEAQEDGIMAKILFPDGSKNIPVGKLIAIVAEEGDDLSKIEVPKEEPAGAPITSASSSSSQSSSSEPSPHASAPAQQHDNVLPEHDRPLFPSVHRLLLEHGITSLDKIKGTGVRGMITKGDVLTYLGQASGPLGTFKFGPSPIEEALASKAKGGAKGAGAAGQAKALLDGPAIRRLIVSSMLQASRKALNPVPASFKQADFDSIIADYLPPSPAKASPPAPSSAPSPKTSTGYLQGLL